VEKMKKGKRQITITGVTEEQYNFLKKMSKKKGLGVSALFKVWINDKIEAEKNE
jgi:hypothetical protein